MTSKEISLDQARRIALAAQGFDRPRPQGAVDIRHIRRAIRQMGLLQLDFVNVLVPAHYLVLYSRLGAYERARLHHLVYQRREFIEQWAHEASIVPVERWPLLEYRRREYRPWPNSPITRLKDKSKYLRQALEVINNSGAITAQDLPPLPGPKRRPGDWHRSLPRWALECHFGSGEVAVADRLPNFQRVYDLPERLIDAHHLDKRVSRNDAQRELLRLAAESCGIATLRDLADYYRMSPREAAPRVAELVEAGDVCQVAVEGWKEPGLLAKGARTPRKLTCSSLLSPFDPLVWFRPRAQRLFDFHYRIEIYVPANKRKWGYYVLPYLLDDRIVARVDLKADRKAGELLVLATHKEENIAEDHSVDQLAVELKSLGSWLDLERVRVSRRGPFARKLADRIKAS
ncbi:MAG: winged helix-turn-helix domain-containing protein [Gammaproteobacteria bacterium]|nr:MAG: winged helix-turn-helix domain-containing protein [Gammaproteobacteria bacterium]